jgi:uncharacterized protein YndB with AHSA1/START domain
LILKSAILLLVVVASILLYAATRPNTFRIQRSIVIAAPGQKIFALLNDFHRWPQWAPQDKEDPAMKRTYSGADRGAGAISEWSGKGGTGSGRMSITESRQPERVVVQTDFVKPFEARNLNEFTLEPEGTATRVTWSMQGSNLYFMKLMGVFVSMDRIDGAALRSRTAKFEGASRGGLIEFQAAAMAR